MSLIKNPVIGRWSGVIMWALNAIISVLQKKGKGRFLFISRTQEKVLRTQLKEIWSHWRLKRWNHKPKNAGSHQKHERGKEQILFLSLWGSIALPTPWLWHNDTDFRLWPPDCERINVFCFKPPSLWQFVIADTENWHNHIRVFDFKNLLMNKWYMIMYGQHLV